MLNKISDTLPITFDKATVELEFREFATDCNVTSCEDAVNFWLNVLNMKSAMGDYKYKHLASLALQLLSIPASNADSERVFSLVRRIKTDFRSRLHSETISALVGVHFNSPDKCCEQSKFESCLLDKAKSCTRDRNLKRIE